MHEGDSFLVIGTSTVRGARQITWVRIALARRNKLNGKTVSGLGLFALGLHGKVTKSKQNNYFSPCLR